MGCVSSKILTRSGSLHEKANQGFQTSGLIEGIIRSNSKSKDVDQFMALLRTSSSFARRSKADADAADQTPVPAATIETINVSELLEGLEEEEEEQERRDDRKEGEKTSPRLRCVSNGAAGRARSFRTLEEFDAMVSRCSSPEHARPATELAAQPDASVLQPLPPPKSSSSEQDASSAVLGQGEMARGAKRRAMARQLGELRTPAPAVFDFRKSGSLRDWLLGGGAIFSPGSYVTPKFGKVPSEPVEDGERRAVFDPEMVAQLEEAMEELSVDEERVLREVLEALEAGETETETEWFGRPDDRATVPAVAVQD